MIKNKEKRWEKFKQDYQDKLDLLPTDFAREWIENLVKYPEKQGTSCLAPYNKEEPDHPTTFCCLGMACELYDSSQWVLRVLNHGNVKWSYSGYEILVLTTEVRNKLGILNRTSNSKSGVKERLSALNDAGSDWFTISEYILNNVHDYFFTKEKYNEVFNIFD